MSNPVTRRQILQTSGMAAGAAALGAALSGCESGSTSAAPARVSQSPTVMPTRRKVGPNEKFNIALIGCGGMGRYKLGNFMGSKQCNVLALCDVDQKQLEGAAADVQKALDQKPQLLKDYRQVAENKEIDLVIVATPDHWHAAPMMLSVAMGKDVYVEKPCCHNIREGRLMLDAAKKYGAVVQVGTHQREIPLIQEAREFIRSGGLGVISQTNTYTYGNETPNGMGNDPDEPVPPGVDYDMWLGPAKARPFNKRRFHNTWRWYFDYGCGMVGDWNVHLQDIIMWTLGARAPMSVSCIGGHWIIEDDRTTPDAMQAVYEFPAPEGAPTSEKGFVQTYTMRKVSGKPWDAGGYGMDFHGTNGMIHLTRTEWKTEPDKWNWKAWGPNAVKGPNGSEWRIDWDKDKKNRTDPGADGAAHMKHVEDFLACVRDRKPPLANIESHYNSVAACHLANVSLLVGRRIFWDADKEQCYTDRGMRSPDREANALLHREYRKGYELPKV
ncbi:MAG: dehydrogenase [Phycisphaerae bacterium]